MNFISTLITTKLQRNITPMYRNYSRWSSRKPVRVIPPEEYEEKENKREKEMKQTMPIEEAVKIKWRYHVDAAAENQQEHDAEDAEGLQNEKNIKKPKKSPTKTIEPTDMLETVIDNNGNFVYTKMKNNDARVGQLLTTVKSKKEITKKNLVLLEGKRLIRDALLAGCSLKYLIFSRRTEIDYLKPDLPKLGAKIYKMPYKEMQMWSDLTTSPGIMGLFRTPSTEHYISENSIPLTIYCDNVREPGNLGAILRVAAGVACRKVILSTGCTSLWDTKVTRSSAGSHFRVQIVTRKNMEHLRDELANPATTKKLFIADNNLVHSSTESLKSSDQELAALVNDVPIVPYYALDLREMKKEGHEIVLIVGGETKGLSSDVYKLAKDFNGVRLNIPMSNGVDSLNTGTALGIITFEMYRQFHTIKALV